jgi:hypothetical protein
MSPQATRNAAHPPEPQVKTDKISQNFVTVEEYHLLGYDAVYPEDGGETILRNVGCNSTDYTASYPRR